MATRYDRRARMLLGWLQPALGVVRLRAKANVNRAVSDTLPIFLLKARRPQVYREARAEVTAAPAAGVRAGEDQLDQHIHLTAADLAAVHGVLAEADCRAAPAA